MITPDYTGFYTAVLLSILFVKGSLHVSREVLDYVYGLDAHFLNLSEGNRTGAVWHTTKTFCQIVCLFVWSVVLVNVLVIDNIDEFPDPATFRWVIAAGCGTVGTYVIEMVWRPSVSIFTWVHHVVYILMTCIGFDSFLFPGIRNDPVAAKMAYIFAFFSMIFFPVNAAIMLYRVTPFSNRLKKIMQYTFYFDIVMRIVVQIILIAYLVYFWGLMVENSRVLWVLCLPLYASAEFYSPYVTYYLYRKVEKEVNGDGSKKNTT